MKGVLAILEMEVSECLLPLIVRLNPLLEILFMPLMVNMGLEPLYFVVICCVLKLIQQPTPLSA